MKKNPHGRILKEKLKKQYLSTVPKSCPYRKTPLLQSQYLKNKLQ